MAVAPEAGPGGSRPEFALTHLPATGKPVAGFFMPAPRFPPPGPVATRSRAPRVTPATTVGVVAAAGAMLAFSALPGRAGPWTFGPRMEAAPLSLLWDTSLTVRAGAGYKDNPLLSPLDSADTPIGQFGLDLFILRLPVDAHRFTFYFSADYRPYFDPVPTVAGQPAARKEQMYVTQAAYKYQLAPAWQAGLTAQHYYTEQVFDASEIGGLAGTVRSVGHTFGLLPSLRYRRADGGYLGTEYVVNRQVFAGNISGFWEYGPRALAGWQYATNSSLELSVTLLDRPFESRTLTDILGTPLAGTLLTATDRREEVAWRHAWDASRHFQTTFRAYHLRREDNGDGFMDYDRYGFTGSLQARLGRWTARSTARWSTYDYDFQIVSIFNPVPRTRQDLEFEQRLEFRIGDTWRVYAEYLHERLRSNYPSDNYRANTVILGTEYDL